MKSLLVLLIFGFISIGYASPVALIEDGAKIIKGSRYISHADDISLITKIGKLSKITLKSLSISKLDNIQDLITLAVKEKRVSFFKQFKYIKEYKEMKNGDKILLKCLRNPNCNLEKYTGVVKNQINRRRRITNFEKNIITSKNAKKIRIYNRTVIKRDIFKCSRSNIVLMQKGLAPIGIDGYKVNLHHLKQQQNGSLVELTQTEHNQYSSILHRYVKKGSEITDRNGDFQIFRKRYWKYRAVSCIARGK